MVMEMMMEMVLVLMVVLMETPEGGRRSPPEVIPAVFPPSDLLRRQPSVSCFAHDARGNHRPVDTGVLRDLAQRSLNGAAHDLDARVLVGVVAFQIRQRPHRVHQRHTAARNHT